VQHASQCAIWLLCLILTSFSAASAEVSKRTAEITILACLADMDKTPAIYFTDRVSFRDRKRPLQVSMRKSDHRWRARLQVPLDHGYLAIVSPNCGTLLPVSFVGSTTRNFVVNMEPNYEGALDLAPTSLTIVLPFAGIRSAALVNPNNPEDPVKFDGVVSGNLVFFDYMKPAHYALRLNLSDALSYALIPMDLSQLFRGMLVREVSAEDIEKNIRI